MNKIRYKTLFLGVSLFSCAAYAGKSDKEELGSVYVMKTARLEEGKVVFDSESDFDEVLKVGFFRVKRPDNINIGATRKFNEDFYTSPKYREFGSLDPVNGFIESELAQTVRFTLERDYWNTNHWSKSPDPKNPNYPPEVQEVGHQLMNVGICALNSILDRFDLPLDQMFQATGGASAGEGSYFLNFNYYDPENADKSFGLGAHTDWGALTVLDAVDEGLQAEIEGVWRPLQLKEGYLTINFGEVLAKLLPGVKACNHRVETQKMKPRKSLVMFIDPRVGPYRESAKQEGEGMVWDWDTKECQLIHGELTSDFFSKLSKKLYGKLNKE